MIFKLKVIFSGFQLKALISFRYVESEKVGKKCKIKKYLYNDNTRKYFLGILLITRNKMEWWICKN